MSTAVHTSKGLLGQWALVTGASGTIGLAIAKALASHGASLVLTGRRVERLQDAAQAIRKSLTESSTQILVLPADVTDEASVIQLFQQIDQNQQTIDLLINNAGTNAAGDTEEISAEEFERVLRVNVTGSFLCAREAMSRMKRRGQGGRIVNVGSLSAISPRPSSCPYTTSKFALLGLTKSLALDARQYNIAVGIIHPGNVQSEMLTAEMIDNRKDEGFLTPDSVAVCVLNMALLPYEANILEMTVLPTTQPFVGRG